MPGGRPAAAGAQLGERGPAAGSPAGRRPAGRGRQAHRRRRRAATAPASARRRWLTGCASEGWTIANDRLTLADPAAGCPTMGTRRAAPFTARRMRRRNQPGAPADARPHGNDEAASRSSPRSASGCSLKPAPSARQQTGNDACARRRGCPGSSFANILLDPGPAAGATMVQGYAAWQGVGRQVNRGERASRSSPCSRPPEPARPGRARGPSRPFRAGVTRSACQPMSGTSRRPAGRLQTPISRCQPPGRSACRAVGRAVLAGQARRVRCRARARRPRRRRHLLDCAPHPRPPGPGTRLTAWALAHQLGHVLIHDTAARQPGETTSGAACTGIRKAEADAVAFIICARYGITMTHQLADSSAWAGADPRAQPAAAILAAGERITAATTQIIRHLDRTLPGQGHSTPAPVKATWTSPGRRRGPGGHPPRPAGSHRPPPRTSRPGR